MTSGKTQVHNLVVLHRVLQSLFPAGRAVHVGVLEVPDEGVLAWDHGMIDPKKVNINMQVKSILFTDIITKYYWSKYNNPNFTQQQPQRQTVPACIHTPEDRVCFCWTWHCTNT